MIELTLGILLFILIVLGLVESYFHRLSLAQLPIRIHVNGSRGKSSVTRLIAAGLRAGGLKILAKTTGTSARIIDENGKVIGIVPDEFCAWHAGKSSWKNFKFLNKFSI